MKALLDAVMNRISDTEPNLKYIDQDWGQLDYFANHPPVKFPCALVDISRIPWSNEGRQIQYGLVEISVSISNARLSNSNLRAPEQQRFNAGAIWTILENVHKALHGWSAGDRFSALIRTSTRRIKRDDGIQEYEVIFTCQAYDASAMEQLYNIMDPVVADEVFDTVPPDLQLNVGLKLAAGNVIPHQDLAITSTTLFQVPEGSVSIGTLTANRAATFSFNGGLDDELFDLDPATGILSFKQAQDFENPPHGRNNLSIKIKAEAGGEQAEQVISVEVIDVCRLTRVRTNFDGSCIKLFFDTAMDPMIDFLDDIVIKVNGSVTDFDKFGFNDWVPYELALVDAEGNAMAVQHGDVISITITPGRIKSDGAEFLTGVTDKPVQNCVPANIPLVIVQESANLANNMHGTIRVGNRFFATNRTPYSDPSSKLVRWNNPDNLADANVITLTGRKNVESICYDAIHNKLYANSWNNDGKFTILSIDPDTLSWSIVFNSNMVGATGNSPAIVTDGTYVYGISCGPVQLFKIRIEDWTLVNVVNLANKNYGHSAQLQVYNDRVEMYAVARNMVAPSGTTFYKVNCGDMSFQSVFIPGLTNPTDDFAFRYINEYGGKAYIIGEGENDTLMAVIDTAYMTFENVDIIPGFGSFFDGTDLYTCGDVNALGFITRFPGCDMTNPIVRRAEGLNPNEILFSQNGKLFFTSWDAPSKLYEFTMNE